MGRAIAVEAARQGAPRVAVADLYAVAAGETAEQVRSTGAAAHAIACDLRRADQIQALVGGAVTAFDRLDVLVNNAGIIETSMTADCAVDALPEMVWDAVYEVNLRAVWLATKYAAPHLRRSMRGPSIVNAASVSGLTGFANAPIYCASKGGVSQLTRATAVDLAPTIRCNCFFPAVIDTPMARRFIETSTDPQARQQAMVARQLIPRLVRRRRLPSWSATWRPTTPPSSRARSTRSTVGPVRGPAPIPDRSSGRGAPVGVIPEGLAPGVRSKERPGQWNHKTGHFCRSSAYSLLNTSEPATRTAMTTPAAVTPDITRAIAATSGYDPLTQ
jgi:NAD(P)-dependent dehydrogenase (short-subunit alcohol dehydrogenase family)